MGSRSGRWNNLLVFIGQKEVMSSFKSISKNSFFLASSQIIEKVLYYLMVIVLARYLGKGDYGRLIYALSFASLFTFFWDFGLIRLITRDVAKDPSNAAITFSLRFELQITSCLAGLIVLLFYLILFEGRNLETYLVLIISITVIFNYLSSSFRSVFIAFEKAQYETFLNLTFRSILFLAILWATYMQLGLIEISMILLLLSLSSLFCSWKLVEGKFFHLHFIKTGTSFWPIVKDCFPIAITIAFTTFYLQINKILLLKWKGEEATGIYGAIDIIVMAFLVISNSLVLATFPIISRENKTDKDKTFIIYKSVFKVLVSFGLPIVLGGILLSKEIVLLIYGNEFSESSEVLKILVWLIPLLFLTNFTGSCLIAIEKQKLLATICGFNALVNLSLNLILIPHFGYLGAAAASIATEGINLIIQYRLLKKYWGASVFEMSWLKVLLALGLMGLFIHWFQGWNIFFILFGAIGIYFFSLFAMKFYFPRGLSNIKSWISKR